MLGVAGLAKEPEQRAIWCLNRRAVMAQVWDRAGTLSNEPRGRTIAGPISH